MSLENIDKSYVECCRNYLRGWIPKYNAQELQISEEAIEELIFSGGEGLGELEMTFRKVILQAKENGVMVINMVFVQQILKNSE